MNRISAINIDPARIIFSALAIYFLVVNNHTMAILFTLLTATVEFKITIRRNR